MLPVRLVDVGAHLCEQKVGRDAGLIKWSHETLIPDVDKQRAVRRRAESVSPPVASLTRRRISDTTGPASACTLRAASTSLSQLATPSPTSPASSPASSPPHPHSPPDMSHREESGASRGAAPASPPPAGQPQPSPLTRLALAWLPNLSQQLISR